MYCNESNYSNRPIIWTSPFQDKCLIIVFQASEHPRLKLLFQYPNTYTLQSSNGGRWASTSLRQSLRSYSEGYWTSSSILQAFPNIYWTTTVISEYLPDSYCCCRARTGVAKRVLALTVSVELKKGLPNVYYSSTFFAELERGLPNVS